MKILKLKSRGPEVKKWQFFLIGQECLRGAADGRFGPITKRATKKFQRETGLLDDGVVGDQTIATAIIDYGYSIAAWPAPKRTEREHPDWPPAPKGLKQLTWQKRDKIYGPIKWKPRPTKAFPGGIQVLNRWTRNIVSVVVPQLMSSYRLQKGAPPVEGIRNTGKIYVHRKIKDPILELHQVWEDKGHLKDIKSWQGGYCARRIRGYEQLLTTRALSCHTYGIAIDMNYSWNQLGSRPTPVGKYGSIRDLVNVAAKLGWYWGGWFPRTDGCHLERADV